MDREEEIRKVRNLPRSSFWLMPAPGERGDLAGWICRFAEKYNGPVFEPHLTVYSGPTGTTGEAVQILKKAAADRGKIRLSCSGLEFSEQYSKACYLSFKVESRLEEMSRLIGQLSARPANYQLKPHLSLFYGRLSGKDRQEIRDTIELPEAVSFGGLSVMATGPQVVSAADVESWYVLDSLRI